MILLLDTDALLVLRHLGLLRSILDIPSLRGSLTEFVARHELSDLAAEIKTLEATELLEVHSVVAKTTEYKQFKALTRAGVDKGEAEALARGIGSP